MSDSHRYDDRSLEEVEKLLLLAGRPGAPPGAKQRALVAVSSVVAASTVASGPAAAASIGVKASLVSSKWLVALSLTGVAAVSGTAAVRQLQSRPASVSAPARSASGVHAPVKVGSSARSEVPPAPPPGPVVVATASSISAPIPSTQPAVTTPLQVAPPVATTAPSFSVEVSTLDQARAAIADREPARALAILDEYAARFPRGVMGPESSVLRIEALLGAGDRTAAERVAHAFLLNNPASPYEQRIQSLLMSNP